MSSAVGGTSSGTSTGSTAGSTGATSADNTGFGSLTSAQFLKIMLTELQQQDPFQPNDSSKLLEEFSSLRNIESQLSFEKSLSNLVLQNQISQAGGLIGKLVAGVDDNNNNVQGMVTSVTVQNGTALLQLDTGATLNINKVSQIANVAQVPAGGVATAPTGSTTTTTTGGSGTTGGTTA